MLANQVIFERLGKLHWGLIFLVTLMASIGFAMLYSAAEGSFYPWAYRQILRFAVFFPVMIIVALIPITLWYRYAYVIYGLALSMLVITEFFGITAMGATRWIKIGPLTVQPSEMMKVCIVFALARYFHQVTLVNIAKIQSLVPPLLMTIVPAVFILKQPDLGTALILLMLAGMVFFLTGVRIWKFAVVFVLCLVAVPVIWANLHDYQKARVITFLDPESDPLGDGYNIIQSKIAIGSGGVSGKGFLEGSQSQLSFLPEKQTDFIFTMLTEEFGFIGGMTILILYGIIIAIGLLIAVHSKNHFGRLMAAGMVCMFFLHVFVNIAMVMGLIPVVGAPLPLLSYGGTMMIAVLVAFGLILNVHLYSDETITQE